MPQRTLPAKDSASNGLFRDWQGVVLTGGQHRGACLGTHAWLGSPPNASIPKHFQLLSVLGFCRSQRQFTHREASGWGLSPLVAGVWGWNTSQSKEGAFPGSHRQPSSDCWIGIELQRGFCGIGGSQACDPPPAPPLFKLC